MTTVSLLSGSAAAPPRAANGGPKTASEEQGAFAALVAKAGAGAKGSEGAADEAPKEEALTRLAEIEARSRAAFEAAATPEERQDVLDGAAKEIAALLEGRGEEAEALKAALSELGESDDPGDLSLDDLFALVAVALGGESAVASAGRPRLEGARSGAEASTAIAAPGQGGGGPRALAPMAEVAPSPRDSESSAAAPGSGEARFSAPDGRAALMSPAAVPAQRAEAALQAALVAMRQSGDTAERRADPVPEAGDKTKAASAATPLGSDAVKAFLQAATARPETPQQALAAAGLAAQDASPEAPTHSRETGGPSQAQSASPPNGFSRTLQSQIRQVGLSEGTTKVELVPRGLGGIEIEVKPAEDGRLKVVLRAENPAVLHALRSDRDGLLALLGDSGASVQDQDLEFSDFGGGEPRDEAPEGAGALLGAAEEEDEVPRPELRPTPAADGRLDIFT